MCCRSLRSFTLVLGILVVLARSAAAAPSDFPYPSSLHPQVEFWKSIYAVYSKHQILIHDTEHLDRVYSVLDYRDELAAGMGPIALQILEEKGAEAEKERIRTLLLELQTLHSNGGTPTGLSEERRKIWSLFAKDKDPRKFAHAADPDRLRSQRGLRERFGEGVRISRRYLNEMEEIFRQEGLPEELTRLPLVESCFDIGAYSKAGAAGIWQFMPATGRRYLTVGSVVDERRDPLRATRAAARYLRQIYETLGSWPLALTAYNHGEGGVLRAVSTVGTTDIGRIVRHYDGPRFGFASRNFYTEFLAALEVERSYRDHFGELVFDPPFHGEDVRLHDPLPGTVAARCASTTPEELAALNPAVDEDVFHRNRNLPSGYVLRVPPGTAAGFQDELARVAPPSRVAAAPEARTHEAATVSGAAFRTHRVAKGQTLSHLAHRYRVSVTEIQRANRLRSTTVRVGQVLKIPTS